MPFIVPKFIERQSKIIGPLTFRQFVFVGGAAVFCFILYFTISFHLFLIVSFVLMAGTLILALGNVGGRSIPGLIKNSLSFLISTKVYLWRKSGAPPKIIKLEKGRIKKERRTSTLDVAEKSRLKSLSAKIETGQR